MKATGIVRTVDPLGRVVLPIELRRTLDIAEGDPLEVFVDNKQIILQKYQPGCVFCGEVNNTTDIKGKVVCAACLKELQKTK